MSNCPEFGWDYSHGGSQGNSYSQMGMNGSSPGGGRQWLHSNQAYTANTSTTANTSFMQSSGPSDPFASYNQSMMNQYGKFSPTYGDSVMGPATVNTVLQDPGQGMGNGMGHGMDESMGMAQIMGQGMRNGLGSLGANQRLSGGSSRRSNGG
ncbi:hypothetical protein KR038_002393 [Drosophila bunnanda]|nr:hypothetical protein KR038_002393 [Drosophila bunnanda]